jgi:hypothetical protein
VIGGGADRGPVAGCSLGINWGFGVAKPESRSSTGRGRDAHRFLWKLAGSRLRASISSGRGNRGGGWWLWPAPLQQQQVQVHVHVGAVSVSRRSYSIWYEPLTSTRKKGLALPAVPCV